MSKRYARHNAVAEFRDERTALRALERLSARGLSRHATSLVTPRQEKRPGAESPTATELRTTSGVGWSLIVGSGAGAAAGAVLVAVLGVLGAAVFGGTGLARVAVLGAISGAVMGATVGSLMGMEAAGRRATMWGQSLQPLLPRVRDGISLVAVHSDDPGVVADGARVLEELGPDALHHLDAEDSFDPPGYRQANLGDTVPSGAAASPGGAQPMDLRSPGAPRSG